MKQFIITLIGLALGGVVFAQDGSDSVGRIMEELSGDAPVAETLSVAKAAPASGMATFPLGKKSASGPGVHRKQEQKAMKDVDLAWGLTLRNYPVSDRFIKVLSLEDVEQVIDISDKFAAVDFPKGSSAIYMPEMGRLYVKNSPANLERIEELLSAFQNENGESETAQVEIKARFVEFAEGALSELGFEWSTEGAVELKDGWQVDSGQSLFADSLRSVPFTQPQALGLGELSADSANWSASRIADTFNDTAPTMDFSVDFGDQFDVVLRALEQTSGVDVLSAPSIVTLSGETASITVGERHNYPTLYEEGVSQGTVLHVSYQDFEEKILGVEMDVTPIVKDEKIDLTINPKINDLVGWEQFQLAPADTSYTWYQYRVGQQFEHEPVVAKLPIFKRREIKTELSVNSGSTVGMGGLITEKLEAFDDRVPVLGSIPLIGRLFRSEGERRVKRNLMIFVTATKVEPNGRLVSTRSFE